MTPEHAAWLDLVHEEILQPELPIVDPHHHLWNHPKERYLVEELHAPVRVHALRPFAEPGVCLIELDYE